MSLRWSSTQSLSMWTYMCVVDICMCIQSCVLCAYCLLRKSQEEKEMVTIEGRRSAWPWVHFRREETNLSMIKPLFQHPIAPHLPSEEALYPCMFALEHSVLSDGNPVHSTIAGPAWAPSWGAQLQAQREGSVAASFWASTAVSTPIEGSLCALRVCAECFWVNWLGIFEIHS